MSETKTITVKEFANRIKQTVANVNIQIGRGHAGEVTKSGEGETSEYLLTLENAIQLIKWLQSNGRTNKLILLQAKREYQAMLDETE